MFVDCMRAWTASWQLNNIFLCESVKWIISLLMWTMSFYHFATSINQPIKIDFFFSTEQCTKWAYKIKPTQWDTVRFINRVHTFFFFSYIHLEWSSSWKKNIFFCVWRKKKTFSIFTCYAKKKIRKMVWDYIWLCLFRSYWTFDLILDRQHFQW